MKNADPIPTVKVKTGETEDDYIIVNEDDYEPSLGPILGRVQPEPTDETDETEVESTDEDDEDEDDEDEEEED